MDHLKGYNSAYFDRWRCNHTFKVATNRCIMKVNDMAKDCSSKDVNEEAGGDGLHQQLQELASYRMPFGKYTGHRLIDLPEPYVVWFVQNGLPGGKLGELLGLVYEIKVNGLEYLFEPLR